MLFSEKVNASGDCEENCMEKAFWYKLGQRNVEREFSLPKLNLYTLQSCTKVYYKYSIDVMYYSLVVCN